MRNKNTAAASQHWDMVVAVSFWGNLSAGWTGKLEGTESWKKKKNCSTNFLEPPRKKKKKRHKPWRIFLNKHHFVSIYHVKYK